MITLQSKVSEFAERLVRAVKVEHPDRVFTNVLAEGAVDLILKHGKPGIQIVGESHKDYSQVRFNYYGDSIYIVDGRKGSVDPIGASAKPASLIKRFLRLFGIGSTFRGSNTPVLVCITQETVPGVSHFGTGLVVFENIKQNGLILQLEGAVDVMASGEVESLGVLLEGAGNVDVTELIASKVFFSMSGEGTIKGHARESIYTKISGSGSIEVAGNPPSRAQDVTGAGKIEYV
jgi:hypothetical protein